MTCWRSAPQSLLEKLARQADTARTQLPKLRESQPDGTVALNRFAEVETLRFASGLGVTDTSPRPLLRHMDAVLRRCRRLRRDCDRANRCTQKDNSKYILAGEVTRGVTRPAVAGLGLGLGGESDSWRTDVQVRSQTMLILDCDAPVAAAPCVARWMSYT